MVYDDGFGVGLDPTTTLRMMSIDLDLDELTQKTLPEYQSMDKIKWSFQPLLDIKKKRGFNLAIKLSQRHIRLNAWESVFDILRPILLAYEGEGANVSILWAYDDGEDNSWYSEKINFGEGLQTTLRELTRQKPIRGWKKSLIKSLDEEGIIIERHKDYLREDDADYHPVDVLTGEGDNEDFEDSSENDSG